MKREQMNKVKRVIATVMTACMLLTVVTVSNAAVNADAGVAPCCEEVEKIAANI